jgi:hypothetical protein
MRDLKSAFQGEMGDFKAIVPFLPMWCSIPANPMPM